MISNEPLEQVNIELAGMLNGEITAGLREWYLYGINGDWDYVVFVVRRCYMLSLIIERVLAEEREQAGDKTSDVEMTDSRTKRYLTDASFLLHAEEIADRYKKTGVFPKILLMDDLMIHGRNVNHLLRLFEERVTELLPDENPIMIHKLLLENVKLNMYARSDRQLLLDGGFELNMRKCYRVSALNMHNLSNIFSKMILDEDIVNACYIYSRHLSEEEFDEICNSSFADRLIKTTYRNTVQYLLIDYVGQSRKKKAVRTLRIVKNRGEGKGYRMIPFVFLPNLSADETENILSVVEIRMENSFSKENGFSKEDVERLHSLYQIEGMRSFNELLTLILSMPILQSFVREMGWKKRHLSAEEKESENRELCKLARNYSCFSGDDVESFLSKIVNRELFSMEALEELLSDRISDERGFVRLPEGKVRKQISKEQCRNIKKMIENYFYHRGLREEIEAHHLEQAPSFQSDHRAERYVVPNWILMDNLFANISSGEMNYAFAYYLQMMDAGVMGVSAFASSDIHVVGMVEYAKAGEQSQMVPVLQLYEWILMLARMEQNCRFRGISMEEELERFCERNVGLITDDTKDSMIQFLGELQSKGEKVWDWSGNYIFDVEVAADDIPSDNRIAEKIKMILKREANRKIYEDYCEGL